MLRTPEIIETIQEAPCWLPDEFGCHLYLWTTNNHLPDALGVVDALGFTYKTILTWAKDRQGLGQYFRGQTEHILFATHGVTMLPRPPKGSTLIQAKRREHSQKPEEAMKLIEATSPAPRLEMFARDRRAGWDSWGHLDGQEEVAYSEWMPFG